MNPVDAFLSLPWIFQVLTIAAPLVIYKVLVGAVPDEGDFDK